MCAALLLIGLGSSRAAPGAGADPVLLAAGDVADCASSGDEATAAILDGYPGATIAALGDTVYESGAAAEYASCYAASWGRHRPRTRPAVGNHEYLTSSATGYYDYFGAAAGPRGKGWYSYDLGAWHVVVLNSNCTIVACGAESEQLQWLRDDLAASDAVCTLAYWHHPRYSSGGVHGGTFQVNEFWKTLYAAGGELVLSAHDHHYERFAPVGLGDAIDHQLGLRQFVVGTGGKSLRSLGTPWPGSEVRNASAFGVLRLILGDAGYDWSFLPEAGRTVTDSGTGSCHGKPGQAPAPPPSPAPTQAPTPLPPLPPPSTPPSAPQLRPKPVPRKVSVCHRGRTIKVPKTKLTTHRRHGDRLGPCKRAKPRARRR